MPFITSTPITESRMPAMPKVSWHMTATWMGLLTLTMIHGGGSRARLRLRHRLDRQSGDSNGHRGNTMPIPNLTSGNVSVPVWLCDSMESNSQKLKKLADSLTHSQVRLHQLKIQSVPRPHPRPSIHPSISQGSTTITHDERWNACG